MSIFAIVAGLVLEFSLKYCQCLIFTMWMKQVIYTRIGAKWIFLTQKRGVNPEITTFIHTHTVGVLTRAKTFILLGSSWTDAEEKERSDWWVPEDPRRFLYRNCGTDVTRNVHIHVLKRRKGRWGPPEEDWKVPPTRELPPSAPLPLLMPPSSSGSCWRWAPGQRRATWGFSSPSYFPALEGLGSSHVDLSKYRPSSVTDPCTGIKHWRVQISFSATSRNLFAFRQILSTP